MFEGFDIVVRGATLTIGPGALVEGAHHQSKLAALSLVPRAISPVLTAGERPTRPFAANAGCIGAMGHADRTGGWTACRAG